MRVSFWRACGVGAIAALSVIALSCDELLPFLKKVELVAPADGDTLGPIYDLQQPVFTWNKLEGNPEFTHYLFQDDLSANFDNPLQTKVAPQPQTPQVSFTPDIDDWEDYYAIGKHYWRVAPISGGYYGDVHWDQVSASGHYYKVGVPCTLETPAPDGELKPIPDLPVFTWRAYRDADYYVIEDALDSNFTVQMITKAVPDLAYSPDIDDWEDDYAVGRHYWRVVPKVGGYYGQRIWAGVSPVRQYEKLAIPLELAFPDSGAGPLGADPPTFEWQQYDGADYYVILDALDSNFTVSLITEAAEQPTFTPSRSDWDRYYASGLHYWRVVPKVGGYYGHRIWAGLSRTWTYTK